MKKFRIIGPPGTGKTTRLTTQSIPAAVERYGPDRVMVTSFTKAAAVKIGQSIVESGVPVPESNVGTLHSICFHALGRPELVVKHINDFNNLYPHLALTPGSVNRATTLDVSGADDMYLLDEAAPGNKLYDQMQLYRARLVPVDLWADYGVVNFYNAWTSWKQADGLMDFEDLIEMAAKEFPAAPMEPRVIFVDEAQDLTPSQVKLVTQWGEQADWYVFAGDDDQTIYGFAGANPRHFWDPLPANQETVLSQSYRIPSSVHERAERFIRAIHQRKAKEYLPRDFKGSVDELFESYKYPDELITEIVYPHIKQGQTVMLLASCAYMLKTIITMLRRFGDPFHNPYRRAQGDWNPLYSSRRHRSPKDRLVSFLSIGPDPPYWDVPNFLVWADALGVGEGGLLRGRGRAGIKALKEAAEKGGLGLHTTRNVLAELLCGDGVEAALNRDLSWFMEHVVGSKQQGLIYPMAVYNHHGVRGMSADPKIIVGTIHSVKGGEADVVVVFPDISLRGMQSMMSQPEEEDAMRRVFYVGMTRAKSSLYLMAPVSKRTGLNYMEL